MSEVLTDMETTQVAKAIELVVFQEYDESQIARAGDYAVGTVVNVKAGPADKISKAFRLRVSAGLGRPVEKLFVLVGQENDGSGHPPLAR